MGKNDRFQIIYTQGKPGILKAGVGRGGLTPLLDSEGRPMKWLPEEGEI